jgi:hypothetical protein
MLRSGRHQASPVTFAELALCNMGWRHYNTNHAEGEA